MRFTLKIAILFSLTLTAIACSSDDNYFAADPVVPDEPGKVYFTINVYTGDPLSDPSHSRADVPELGEDDYYGPADDQYEFMNTLRVIIVRPDGTVEHNEYISSETLVSGVNFISGPTAGIRLQVIGDENKTVYLFANEASMRVNAPGGESYLYDFNTISIGSVFPKDEIADLRLSCTPSEDNQATPLIDNSGVGKQYLPMTESFGPIYVKGPTSETADVEQSADLFITRATVKFGFAFTPADPTSTIPFTIDQIEISKLADTEYLMPRAQYTPAKFPLIYSAERYISQYNVPDGATASTANYTFNTNIKYSGDPTTLPADGISYTPAVYFPETELAAGESYQVRIHLTTTVSEYSGWATLPNLPALPRNTYVMIKAAVGGTDNLAFTVDVIPYIAVWLDPKFGFEELLPHKPVIGEYPPWLEIYGPDGNKEENPNANK